MLEELPLNTLRSREDAIIGPARKLYAGRQQQYISDVVDSLRANEHSVIGVVFEDLLSSDSM
jgi:hypothetical protein